MRTQCTDRVHAVVVLQKKSWASIGLEFGVQWVVVFTATRQSVYHNQKPDVYFINRHLKIWALQ